MPITVLSAGKLKEKYLRAACDEYTKGCLGMTK